MTQQTINPVRVSVSVGLDQQRCFEVFTDEMTSWWPESHHIGEAPIEKVIVRRLKNPDFRLGRNVAGQGPSI